MKSTTSTHSTSGFIIDNSTIFIILLPFVSIVSIWLTYNITFLTETQCSLLRYFFYLPYVLVPFYLVSKLINGGDFITFKKRDYLFQTNDAYVEFIIENSHGLIVDTKITQPIIEKELNYLLDFPPSHFDKSIGVFKVSDDFKVKIKFYKKVLFFVPCYFEFA